MLMRSATASAFASAFALSLRAIAAPVQGPAAGSRMSPKEVVEQLWNMAVRGELLTADGWGRTARLFAHPTPDPGNKAVAVVSNYWSVMDWSLKDTVAQVTVDFQDAGKIDLTLRYSPPPQVSGTVGTGKLYRLVLVPTRRVTFGPNGKTVVNETSGPDAEWKIETPQEPPWTTVNGAIRYVLEQRDRTKDPVTKRNAEATILALMRQP